MATNIVLDGIERIRRFIEDLFVLYPHLREPTELANELYLNRVRLYPPPPGGSEYQRTFEFQDSWEPIVVLGEILGIVRSSGVPYNEYVMGEAQAWMHQGRWDTVEQIVTDEEAAILQIFEDHIQGMMNRV